MPFFIYINGFSGVGKLTIGNEVCKRIQERYDELRADFRRHAIATRPEVKETVFIFTDPRESNGTGSIGVEDYQRAAEVRGVPFISIILHCKLDENSRRLEGRSSGGESRRSTKLADGKVLRRVREIEAFQCGAIVHHAYTIATKKKKVPSPRRSHDVWVL
ncbi:hypothetical protein LY78DRAFT_703424 [Colletotrichum sublineola]|nr:hypothetical protein LY78DRAFT_703424 [Colletotrichum sublineola]